MHVLNIYRYPLFTNFPITSFLGKNTVCVIFKNTPQNINIYYKSNLFRIDREAYSLVTERVKTTLLWENADKRGPLSSRK